MTSFKSNTSFEERFNQRKKLLKPFLKKLKEPVLVHATSEEGFTSILKEGVVRIPSTHNNSIKCPHLAKILEIDEVIYLSLGFVYTTAYNFKYNLLFDIKLLNKLILFKSSVNYQAYNAILKYLYFNDQKYFQKMRISNVKLKTELDNFVRGSSSAKPFSNFEFWKVEDNVSTLINKYSHKKQLINLAKSVKEKLLLTFPKSYKYAKENYANKDIPEIISLDSIKLNDNCFLGVYVKGKIPKQVKHLLLERYPDKLLFDGSKIKPIRETLLQKPKQSFSKSFTKSPSR